MLGYLIRAVYYENLKNLSELKDAIRQYVCSILSGMLRATVENILMQFQLLSENSGRNMKHAF